MSSVAEANPIKQGLKHPYDLTFTGLFSEVAEANPIKQGLKLGVNHMVRYMSQVAEANPIKQGLKQKYGI